MWTGGSYRPCPRRTIFAWQVHGGAPYGAGTLAGDDGLRQPSKFELGYAKHQASARLLLLFFLSVW